tara:strand:- start:4252 stop:4641 length:390 start_codon:yes stop_codon:yes gene_type:complete
MFITKKIYKTGPYADYFAQGVLVGDLLTLAGQIGVNPNGETPNDLKGQMLVCYENIQAVLAEFGATMEHVVDETWFVTDVEDCMQQVGDLFSARETVYGCEPEVSQTLVGVTALVDPALKIEIKCIARV